MNNGAKFRQRIRNGEILIGTAITFGDPAVTDALCDSADFYWIDAEHSALTNDQIQGHIISTKGTDTAPLVRVPWNDPVRIKPILDMGAAGVIVPFVRNGEEARLAVAACRYPPVGIRGWAPRRPSNYGRKRDADQLRREGDETVLCFVQIEHFDSITNLEEILDAPGLDGIAIGPMDLSASMGLIGQLRHPSVFSAIEKAVTRASEKGLLVGTSIGHDVDLALKFIEWGAQWIALGADFSLMIETADRLAQQIRSRLPADTRS